MKTKVKRIMSLALCAIMVLSMVMAVKGLITKVSAAVSESKFHEVIEFEDANRFEQNGRNEIDSTRFSGYSGSGYVYLVSGWGEVGFTVPQDGEYKITVVTNADTYKENWLYLDEGGAGTLYTNGNQWQAHTETYWLSKGSHKFGVSSNWGYTALDYVVIESVGTVETEETTEASTEAPSMEETTEASTEGETGSDSGFATKIEFEDEKRFENNGSNKVASDMFSGYSGSGYVYLVSGWGEVGFTVPRSGEYKITVVTNADSYKENWLYLDENGAGTLYTDGNRWQESTATYNLSAGQHKFGVSSNWGYTALDYVVVEEVVSDDVTEETTAEEETEDPIDIPTNGGMFVQNGKLYDGNGNEFIMRGINIPHAWYTDYTKTSIDAVAGLGANCVRVVVADGTEWTKTTRSELENIISWCEAKGLICILEVHDHTGKDDVYRLNIAVNYWKEMKDLLNEHKDYVIVNIANEWLGTWNLGSTWTSAYQDAIRSLRNAGLENVIMVDAAGYGQETATCIDNCQSVYSADSTGNTMFSIHMYSVAGKDASTVKSNIDAMISKGVCFCIGEFGDYQNGGDVDEETVMSYCTEKSIGYAAWSWKGNSGTDSTLDLSNDWEGTNLTTWGKYVFYASDIGIQATSRMAYTLKYYNGQTSDIEVEKPDNPDDDDIDVPSVDETTELEAGLFADLDGWYISGEGDDTESTVTTMEALSNGGFRVNVNLAEEQYPYLSNMVNGLDLSANKTLNVVVRNNNLYSLQIQPVFKVGDLWTWTEYDQYQEVPAQTAVILTFDLTGCADLDDVKSIMFRIQGGGASFSGSVDFFTLVTDYNTDTNPYAKAIAELNRPKTASFFTWKYAESSWSATTDYSCDSDGVITVNFSGVTSENAAGPQTETNPGTGKGRDFTAYGTLKSTITNNSNADIHITLVMKSTGNWTWQENAGSVNGKSGELIIEPGQTVDVVYDLDGSEWKSEATGWQYTGELQDADDVRAIAFKIYTGEGDTATGSVTISDFSFEF